MSYVGVPVSNMLLEHVIKLGDAILFPYNSFEYAVVAEDVDEESIEFIRRIFLENKEFCEALARQGICMLLFQAEIAEESIGINVVEQNKLLYTANRYLDYLMIKQCVYSKPEYLFNAAGQVGQERWFLLFDANGRICSHIYVDRKYYSMQPGLGLDVSDFLGASEDRLYHALYSKRKDEVYIEYRTILGHACDAMRIGDMNRCFAYLFTKVERMGHCEEYSFRRNKVRIISCLSKDQSQFDIHSEQLYFYSKRIRTDITHKGINYLDQIPLKHADRVINDLLSLIVRFCTAIIDTGIETFASLDTYLTRQEAKFQYTQPKEMQITTSGRSLDETKNVYAACIANMSLNEPVKVGNVIFIPPLSRFPFQRYYSNYVKKDAGGDDYDEEFKCFSVEDLEYIMEFLKDRKWGETSMALIFQQPYLPLHEEGPNGYEFLCDYICKKIENALSCLLLVSDEWTTTGVLPSKVGMRGQIRWIRKYDDKTGVVDTIPGRVYQGYFEPPQQYQVPDRSTVYSSAIYSIFNDNVTNEVARTCKKALERLCASYYIDDLNLRVLYLFDILDMLHPDTTSGEELRKRILPFTCNNPTNYYEQIDAFKTMRESKRNPLMHGGKSIYDLVDTVAQIYEVCDELESWITKFCIRVNELNISTMAHLKQTSTDLRNAFH